MFYRRRACPITRIVYKLLCHLEFYDDLKIREKLKVIYSAVKTKIVHEVIKGHRVRHDILLSCFGNLSKSGSSYVRLFAQENDILSNNITFPNKISEKIEDKNIKAVIIIDDVIGSGDTVIEELEKLNEELGDLLYEKKIQVFICSVYGLNKGIDKIIEYAKKVKFAIIVNVADIVNENDQWYHGDSGIFSDFEERETASRIVMEYGKKLTKDMPFGHDGCGLLVVTRDNCPDNTIGIIWDTTPRYPKWIPLFKRI